MTSRKILLLALASVAAAYAPQSVHAQRASQASTTDTSARSAAIAADAEMDRMGGMDMSHDVHMHMTDLRTASPADSVRAAALVAQMRSDLAKYRDVRVAQADGFKQFLPNVPQSVYHFTNWRWAIEEAFRFNPAKPTSLLYRKNADGSYTLLGAMYTEPLRASEQDLNQRIPLSVAQWHQHVNWCMPKKGEAARWQETRNGKPIFGPKSPIATESGCNAVGGDFHPHLFGWMVHANVFQSDDPHVIWSHVD